MIIGYITNWLAIRMIFEPVEPHGSSASRFHGLFMRRQPEVADVYAGIIADDIVTIANIGDELLNGPRSDRTRGTDRDRDAAGGRPRSAGCEAGARRDRRGSTTRSASRSPPRRSSTR